MSSSVAENVGKCQCGGKLRLTGTREFNPTKNRQKISFKVACDTCGLLYDASHKRFDHDRDHVQAELVLTDPIY